MSTASEPQGGRPLVGTFLGIGHADVAELVGRLGFDLAVIDTEHAAIGRETVQAMVRALALGPTFPMVRVATNQPSLIAQALDAGAAGVLVPQVNSAAEATAAVVAARYPPAGRRGLGPGRASLYGVNLAEYRATANDRVQVFIQVETQAALADLDNLVATPGVDLFFVGPADLSQALGHPGDLDHPVVTAAIETVLAACRDAGRPFGIFAPTPQWASRWIAAGAAAVFVGSDLGHLVAGARAALSSLGR